MEIIVVATKKRKALIQTYLAGLSYKMSYSEDYNLPKDFNPSVAGATYNHLGTYRCFKGHQEALSKIEEDYALILEDDAVPNVSNWFDEIEKFVPLLQEFDIVSLHGRGYIKDLFKPVASDQRFLQLAQNRAWIVAALAYLVKKESVASLLQNQYNGTPWDLILYQNYSFCVLENSIFNHDRSEGSLVDAR